MSLIDKQNPIVTFIYFLLTIIITMFTMNPIILVASFVSSLLLFCLLVGIKRTLISGKRMLRGERNKEKNVGKEESKSQVTI